MEILITSKTHKGKAACVGGLILQNNKFVRLLNPGNWDQYTDTKLNIGDVWDIDFTNRPEVIPPHIEDVIIQNKRYLRSIDDVSNFLQTCGVNIWTGKPNQIFEGKLRWTHNGSGYIWDKANLPNNSVGFWIVDKDLTLDDDNKHYNYPSSNDYSVNKRFPYVGFKPKVKIIPNGTLVRLSLARWWSPEDSDIEKRCYLQLSGWYGLPIQDTITTSSFIDDDDDILDF